MTPGGASARYNGAVNIPPEIFRLLENPIALGKALGYKGDNKGRKQFGRLHDEIMTHALSAPRTWCAVPRGHAKSTLLSVILPIWKLLREPDRRIMVASATLDLGKKLVGEIRDRLNGDIELRPGLFVPVREVFPHLALSPADARAQGPTQKLNIAGRTSDGGREPSIFAASVTSNLAGNHPTDAHFDDLSNEQNCMTYAQRQKVIRFVQQAEPIMRDHDSPITVIGTPWAFADLLDYLTDHESWKGLRYGCWDGVNPVTREKDGKGPGSVHPKFAEQFAGCWPLCPTYLSADEIQDLESKLDPTFVAAQYHCHPIPANDALFERGLTEAAALGQDFPDGPEILLWDPTHRVEGDRGNSSTLSLNGLVAVRPVTRERLGDRDKDRDRNVFIPTGAWEIPGGTDEAVRFIEDLVNERPEITDLWIEKKAAQETLKPWLEERGRLEGVRIRMQKTPNTNLAYRLMGLGTAMRKGHIRFPKSFQGKSLLFQRLHEYPMSDSDDLLAALALLASHWDRRGDLIPRKLTSENFGTLIWPSA